MESRQQLPPDLRRRFRTGRPCLDLTHTGGDGPYAVWELLDAPADAVRFLGVVLGVELRRAARQDLVATLSLRGTLTRAARALAVGDAPRVADIELINAAARHPSLVPALSVTGAATLVPGTVQQALSSLARDAIDLFGGPLAERIRVCAADDCALLFVDASRPGLRRWCSMERCGDRAKKRHARSLGTRESGESGESGA
jgi:predicted RNA-binding Zn ribbon-like protein